MSQTIIKQKQKKSKKKFNLPSRKAIALAGLGALLLIATGAIVRFVINNQQDDAKEEKVATLRELTVDEKVNHMARQGDYEGGQKYLDEQTLNKATNTQEEAAAYIDKASLALNSGKYDEAKAFAEQANGLYESRQSLNMLALAHKIIGDKESAIRYYEMVLATYSEEEKKDRNGELEYLDIEMNIGDLRE